MMLVFFCVDCLLHGSCFPVFLKVQDFLMFPVKVMIVFSAVLFSVTLFTCRRDGCDVFFSSYVQCSLCLSHVDGFGIFTV